MPVTPSPTGTGRPRQLIDLALQGGGSHGAFTWGVLDRLLEEPWLQIEAISGTSAGAMNAAVMADGHANDGSRGAREALEAFWRSVSKAALFSPLQRSPIDMLMGRWTLDHSPAYVALGVAIGRHSGIHGAGRGTGNGLDLEPRFLEQPVQHAPGEGAMRPSTLQRQVDQLQRPPVTGRS